VKQLLTGLPLPASEGVPPASLDVLAAALAGLLTGALPPAQAGAIATVARAISSVRLSACARRRG
jgi:hypothetical protein